MPQGEIETESDPNPVERLRGVVPGIEWALGREAVAPAILKVQPSPDWRQMRPEATWAAEIETGVRAMPEGMSKHYAGGLVASLFWASGQTDVTPA